MTTQAATDSNVDSYDTSTKIGFCSKCGILRQDGALGPVTPCVCFVEHHANDCQLKIAVRCPISVACEAHGWDSCPACFSCTCGIAIEEMFVCGKRAFLWDPEAGLIPTRIGDRKLGVKAAP